MFAATWALGVIEPESITIESIFEPFPSFSLIVTIRAPEYRH